MKNDLEAGAIVKWAGGKSKLAPIIEEKILKELNISQINTYVEPFVGGGSFFFYITQRYNFKNKVISDVNKELINLYLVVKETPKDFMSQVDSLQNEYNCLETMEDKALYFYDVRNRYNEGILEDDELSKNILLAADFLFLNKIGFNGLYRVNSKGLYNVPFGKRTMANLYKKENIFQVSKLLQDTEVLYCDYCETKQYANEKSLFYFDPPYRPLSSSSSFTSYAKSDFNDNNQIELAKFCHDINRRGARFALSNSDPKNSDEEDNFFDDLYCDYRIERIQARRMIGAKSNSRGKVSEILVLN